jgi:uncharacterized protein YbbC (DUF1343 family)
MRSNTTGESGAPGQVRLTRDPDVSRAGRRVRCARAAILSAIMMSALACSPLASAAPNVSLGIDQLAKNNFAALAGKRVGVIVNPASVDSNRKPTALVLHEARNVNLVALFGPEHGVWGDEYAGDTVADKVDPLTGLKAFSLYGKTRKPTKEMLDTIDVMVFDLQDIGSRSYTYISTMKNVLEACAEANKPLIILDRPNPLGGLRIEGGPVTDEKFRSMVSYLDVPYLHGMTMGELALMTRDQIAPNYKGLTVVKMEAWKRDMTWADTGLDWIMPSPHVPHVSSIAGYAATGIFGELYQASNGVGYTLPFEVVGSPKMDGIVLAEKLNKLWPGEDGVFFRAMRFKPFYATNKGEVCGGVQVHIDPKTAPSLIEINYRIIEALGAKEMMTIANSPATKPSRDDGIAVRPEGRRAMFDKVSGGNEIGDALTNGDDLEPVFAKWRAYCDEFKQKRAKYLLY